MPVFNGERYVREAIDSIFAQMHRPLEIIIVDDGSTDGTRAAVANYGDQVRYVWQPNSGPATARNLGLSRAAGEFIAFIDADDLWHVEKLARQMARFAARPELDFCVAHVQNFWISELHDEEERFRNNRVAKPIPGYVTGTLLARRRVFDTIGVFNTKLAHGDSTDWFLRAAERGAVMELLADVLLFRRLHPANRSRLLASRSRDEFLEIVKACLDQRRGSKKIGD
jgi:glycosyltransferase involved in cell wall biosynthesis